MEPASSQATVERYSGPEQGDTIETLMHLHRYQLALPFCQGQRCLDFGCGTGYGTKILAEGAPSVIGVELDDEVAKTCSLTHGDKNGTLRFSGGGLETLAGFPDGEFGCITCFEVIEHLPEAEQDRLALELKRLLKKEGVLLLSTPDSVTKRRHYRRFPDWRNPYHIKELSAEELKELLNRHFAEVTLLPQSVEIVSLIGLPKGQAGLPPEGAFASPWVNLALCGHQTLTIPATWPLSFLPARTHLLEDTLLQQARLIARIDALTAELLQVRREITNAQIAVLSAEERAQKTVAELNSSLAIRATHILDRWPRAKDALKGLAHRLTRS